MSKRWILATCLTGTLVPAVFAMAACSSSGTMPAATTVPASATDTATPTATATPSPTPSPAPTPTPVLSDLQKAAQTLIVTATTSRVLPVDYNAYRFSARFEADFTFQNTGTKGIHAFSGILIISDLFGTPIKQSKFTITDKPVSAGGTVADTGLGFDLNQFMDADNTLATTAFANLKFAFTLQSVIYDDGTQVGSVPGGTTPPAATN